MEAQASGVYHRDIKDENVMIERKTLKTHLIDFGSGAFVKEGEYTDFEGELSDRKCLLIHLLVSSWLTYSSNTV